MSGTIAGRRGRGRAALAVVVGVGLLTIGAGPLPRATAERNTGGHTVVSNQEFRAYVVRGETIRFAVDVARRSVQPSDVGYTVTLKGPGGIAERCRLPAGAAVGRACVLGPARARSTGVWQAAIVATGGPDIEGINATDAGPAGDFPTLDWDVTVRSAGGAAVPGRVWAPERYSMFNSAGGSIAAVHDGAAPLTLFYLHDNGWLYRARYESYNGIYSRHRATSLGVVDTRTGTPVYRSTSNQVPRSRTIDHPEQDYYKIFLDRPDSSMPATATAWDGRTLVVNRAPAPVQPSLTGLTFTEDDDLTTHAGSYALAVSNHSGVVDVVIDADLDGAPSAGDVRISHPVNAGPASVPVQGTWDGRAPDGTVVDPRRPVKLWAAIDRVGEIHFTSSDVEYRSGIDVQRLNGPAAGRSTLHWDDRRLKVDGKHQARTAVLDGRAGVDSTGGVHDLPAGGTGGGFGWGNERFIDDWTYVPVGIEALATTPADLRLVKTRRGSGPVSPGDTITWQVEIGNFGDTVAHDTVVTDLATDPEVEGVRLSDPSAGTVDGLVWQVGDLAPNTTATVTVTGTVAAGATGPLENRAVVSSPDDPTGPPADPATQCEDNATLPADADNCDVVVTPVTPDPADLRILKEQLTRDVGPGDTVTWRVRVGNFGEGPAHDVVMSDLGALVRGGASGPVAVTDLRLSDPSRGSVDGLDWSVGDLAPGDTATVRLTGTVPTGADRGVLVNRAVVSSPDDPTGPPEDPATQCEDNATLPADADGCDVVATPFADRADLVVDKEAVDLDLDRDAGTGTVTWRIRVRNQGPGRAPDVVVHDLPGAAGDPQLTVVDGPSRGHFDAATGSWEVGDLAEGAGAWVVVRTTHPIEELQAGVVNTATVTSPVDPYDPGSGCQANEDLAGDTDNCDHDEVTADPPAAAAPPSPTAWIPNLGGPAGWGIGLALGCLVGGGALLLGARRGRRAR